MNSNEDIVQRITGNFGRWQLRTIIFIFLSKIPATWFLACISFTAPLPKDTEYYCKTTNGSINYGISPGDKCHIYKTVNRENFNYSLTFEAMDCNHFEYNSKYASIVTQFDLVCSREILISVTQISHAYGSLVGGLLALHIMKYISPKKLILIGMIGQIICGNLTGLVSTYILHVYFRCITGVFCAFMTTAGQILLSNITFGKARTLVISLSEIFSSVGLILMPGLAMFVDSYTTLYAAMSCSLILFLYPHSWITDSPQWYLKHFKINEALKILLESAAYNNRDVPIDLESNLYRNARELQSTPSPNYWCIWDGETPRHFIILLHWCWSVSVVIYTVMILMIRFIGVDRMYVSTFSMGVAEILGILMGLCIILYTRRRWLLAGLSMILAGVTTYFLWLIPENIPQYRQNAYELAFWLILKLINSSSLVLLASCSGDLVSAEKRPMLMISTGSFSRYWLTVVPFSLTLLKIHRLIPITIFATVVISSGCIMCYFSRYFRNLEQPKIEKIPTPGTFRKISTTILSNRRESMYSNATDELSLSEVGGYDNFVTTISVEELWKYDEERL